MIFHTLKLLKKLQFTNNKMKKHENYWYTYELAKMKENYYIFVD